MEAPGGPTWDGMNRLLAAVQATNPEPTSSSHSTLPSAEPDLPGLINVAGHRQAITQAFLRLAQQLEGVDVHKTLDYT
jgi:hypothetical protein